MNSDTAKRRLRLGRAQAARERPMAQPRSQREREYEEPRTAAPQPLSRGSADNVTMADRHQQKPLAISTPSPRPASVQPVAYESRDSRRSSTVPPPPQQQAYPGGGYMTATAQYTVSMPTSQATYSTYGSGYGEMQPPPPYSDDTKRGGGGNQPSTTGTQGFARYATAGPPDQQQPPSRRHGPK